MAATSPRSKQRPDQIGVRDSEVAALSRTTVLAHSSSWLQRQPQACSHCLGAIDELRSQDEAHIAVLAPTSMPLQTARWARAACVSLSFLMHAALQTRHIRDIG